MRQGAQRRVVDGVSDACNYVRVARPGLAKVNELFGIYLAYCFMKNYMRGYKIVYFCLILDGVLSVVKWRIFLDFLGF